MPTVSVIIPTYNREEAMLRCLPSVYHEADGLKAEIIVVDQTGYDKSRLAQAAGPTKLQYLRLKKPNLPAARNAGAKVAFGEILTFIDDDAVPQTGWLQAHLKAYENPCIGAVAGGVLDTNAKGDALKPVEYDSVSGRYYTDFGCATSQETISVPGVNFSVRRSVWENVRFDESYRGNAYFEEVDFAFRLRRAGWKILFEPKARVRHDLIRSGGCRQTGAREAYYRFRNSSLFYFRFSRMLDCPSFYRMEKNYLEYISRTQTRGHNPIIILSAAAGTLAGALRGVLTSSS